MGMFRLRGTLRKKATKKSWPGEGYEKFAIREPKLVAIPHFGKISDVDVRYPLMEPFAYARVKWNPAGKKLIYTVEEPELTTEENTMLIKIENGLSEMVDIKISSAKNTGQIIDYIQKKISAIISEMKLKVLPESYNKIMYFIVRDFVGLNEIEPMMHDPYIEDIGCTGLNSPVYIIHRRFGSLETGLVYRDFERLSNFVIKMAERCGRYISYATPLLDGTLPDGSRVQASLARDVTTKGPTFTIRKFRRNPFSMVDIVNMNTASADIMAYLWVLIEYGASVMICGGVSTGKTSLLNVLSMFIPREKKIISIEDTREINLPHENWIPSVARMGFGMPDQRGKRYGEVDLFDLLKESFRQNPDYVIVGEVRGKEAYVLFQGMASGHPSIGTIHAGSIEDVMKRLESPPIELSPSLVDSLDVLIVMVNAKEKGKSARRVKEIVEVQAVDQNTGRAQTNTIFRWIPSEDIFEGNFIQSELLQRISFREGITLNQIKQEMENRKRFIKWLRKNKIVQYNEVCELINLYSKEKERVLSWINKNQTPFKKEADNVYEKGFAKRIASAVKTGKNNPEPIRPLEITEKKSAPEHADVSEKDDISTKPLKEVKTDLGMKSLAKPAGLLYKTPPPPGKKAGVMPAPAGATAPAKEREVKPPERKAPSGNLPLPEPSNVQARRFDIEKIPERVTAIRNELRENIGALRSMFLGQERQGGKQGIDISEKLLRNEEKHREDFLDIDADTVQGISINPKPGKRIKMFIPDDILPGKGGSGNKEKTKPAGKPAKKRAKARVKPKPAKRKPARKPARKCKARKRASKRNVSGQKDIYSSEDAIVIE